MIDLEYVYGYLLKIGYEALLLDSLSEEGIFDLYFEVQDLTTEEETQKAFRLYHEEKHKLSKEARHYIGNYMQKCLYKGESK